MYMGFASFNDFVMYHQMSALELFDNIIHLLQLWIILHVFYERYAYV